MGQEARGTQRASGAAGLLLRKPHAEGGQRQPGWEAELPVSTAG